MPGSTSVDGAKRTVDAITGRAAPGVSTTYLMLLSAVPLSSDTFAQLVAKEVSTAGYARQTVTWTAPTTALPSESKNTTAISFGPFTADPPNIVGCALVTALTGSVGEVRFTWTLDNARDAAINESLQFPINTLVVGGS